MSAEEILISHDGQTIAAHATCGAVNCTEAMVRAAGVPDSVLEARGIDLTDEPIGDARITVGLLGESDEDVWCFACGGFIRHGLSCTCPELDGEKRDPRDLDGPHIDFAGHPALRDFLT